MGFLVGVGVGAVVGAVWMLCACAAAVVMGRAIAAAGGPSMVVPDYVPDAWLVDR